MSVCWQDFFRAHWRQGPQKDTETTEDAERGRGGYSSQEHSHSNHIQARSYFLKFPPPPLVLPPAREQVFKTCEEYFLLSHKSDKRETLSTSYVPQTVVIMKANIGIPSLV